MARGIKKIATILGSQANYRLDGHSLHTTTNNFATYANHSYDTGWTTYALGVNTTLQTQLKDYVRWLNTPQNLYNAALAQESAWSLTSQKYLYEELLKVTITNQSNSTVYLRAIKVVPKHDIPAAYEIAVGAGSPPATATKPAPNDMLIYQDAELAQSTSGLALTNYFFRNYNWKKPSSFTKFYRVKYDKKQAIRPGRSVVFKLKMRPNVLTTQMIGNIAGDDGSFTTSAYYCFKHLYQSIMFQIIPEVGLAAASALEVVPADKIALMFAQQRFVKIQAVKNNTTTYTHTSAGLTSDVGAPINIISWNNSVGVASARAI